MRIDRRFDIAHTRFHIRQKLDQAARIETFGKALATHQVALFEDAIWKEETVGRDEIDLGMVRPARRSEEHTSELQSLMRISYAVFCLTKKNRKQITT